MIRLSKDDYHLFASLLRQPYGQALLQILKQQLEQTNVQLRTATDAALGWRQGEAQCLAQLIESFERGDELSK